MGLIKHIAGAVLLGTSNRFHNDINASNPTTAAAASAQVVSYSDNNYGISVNVPADTASSGTGSIFIQISAPSGTQWVGVGQGNQMSGANMLLVYAASSSNVTVSPRLGTGEVMPRFNSDGQITVLDGSGVAPDGSFVANIRCDSCLSWNGGSVSPTSTSSDWIYAYRNGDAINSADQSATLTQHDTHNGFTLDLTQGTGGNSANPFISAAQTGTASPTASSTGGVSTPVASSNPSSNSGSSTSSDPNESLRRSHGILMSVLFVGLFPIFALTMYLPFTHKVRYVHAPLQLIGSILLIVGMALGIRLGQRINDLDGYHMIIGFVVVGTMILFQPAMGIYQHLYYTKTGGRSVFGQAHRWLGRTLIALGIINGGLGYNYSGETDGYVPYGVVAGIVFVIYLAIILFSRYRNRNIAEQSDDEKALHNRNNYEMQRPRQAPHKRLGSSEGGDAYARNQRNGGNYI